MILYAVEKMELFCII